ncbi:MAG: sulfite exporter TauE/SafE family protein, partial [Chloroflexi bacterium]
MSLGDLFAIAGGLVAGLLSGLIGIGGGLLFVPIMTIGFRMAQPIAQGTSLAAVIPTAIVGGITHIRQGNVIREVAIWMGVGGVGGALIGAFV